MANKRVTERRIVDVLVSYIREKNKIKREVPHYEKRIDIVMIETNTNDLCGIEAKTSNWSRAVAQAVVNLAAVHKSYIAIYNKHVHCVSIPLLEKYGIGLIAVGTKWGEVEYIREADRSLFTNKLVTQRIRARFL